MRSIEKQSKPADAPVRARGPRETARDALKILESMRGGEAVDEEIADVLKDAVWEAYGNGLTNGKASRRKARR